MIKIVPHILGIVALIISCGLCVLEGCRELVHWETYIYMVSVSVLASYIFYSFQVVLVEILREKNANKNMRTVLRGLLYNIEEFVGIFEMIIENDTLPQPNIIYYSVDGKRRYDDWVVLCGLVD